MGLEIMQGPDVSAHMSMLGSGPPGIEGPSSHSVIRQPGAARTGRASWGAVPIDGGLGRGIVSR
jgi:hypothetical protein